VNHPGVVLAPYRRLFSARVSRRLAAADACARVPQGMLSLTVLLVVAQHASMRVAGLGLAAYTLAQAATAPARGRFADRRGVTRAAALCCAGYAAALLALLATALDRQPAAVPVALAAVAGCCTPPLSPALRSLWSRHTPAGLRQTAFALDAAVFDVAYITGPVLASSLATGVAPAAALGLMLALTGAAIILTGRQPADPDASAARHGMPGPLRSAGLRELLITAALTNAALSATEVALTAYVRLHHVLWASGPLLAEVSAGSVVGSLLLGTRSPAASAHRRLSRLLAGYAAGLAAVTAGSACPPLLAVLVPLAGLCLGPSLATLFAATAHAAPRANGTEAQAWLNSIMNGGGAGGAALAGLTAARPILGLAIAVLAAALAALTAIVIKRPRLSRRRMRTDRLDQVQHGGR
jgi:MFS family permease